MKRILIIKNIENILISKLSELVDDYLINNGYLPKEIHMPQEEFERYVSLLIGPYNEKTFYNIKFRNIPIKIIKK